MLVTSVRGWIEDAVRREQAQHAVESVGVEAGLRGDLGRCCTRRAHGIRYAAVRDDVQAASNDVGSGEIGDELRRFALRCGRRLSARHGGYWLAARCRSMVMPRLRR